MAEARADVSAYLDMVRALSGPSVIEMDPAAARAMSRQGASMVEQAARAMRRQDLSISHDGSQAVPVRLYSPSETTEAAPVIVFFHGGGWVLGDVEGYDALCSEIAYQTELSLVSVDYRLAPEHRFPAAVHDCFAAARWTAESPPAIGHAVSGIVLVGDSAGGALAAAASRDLLSALPAPILAQWLIYPVTDISQLYPSDIELSALFNLTEEAKEKFYGYYLGDHEREALKRHPHVSPLFGERWAGLPPAVIFTCALDPLRDQGRAYAAKLANHGVPTIYFETRQVHGSFTMRKMLPSAQQDLLRGIAALKLLLEFPADNSA